MNKNPIFILVREDVFCIAPSHLRAHPFNPCAHRSTFQQPISFRSVWSLQVWHSFLSRQGHLCSSLYKKKTIWKLDKQEYKNINEDIDLQHLVYWVHLVNILPRHFKTSLRPLNIIACQLRKLCGSCAL